MSAGRTAAARAVLPLVVVLLGAVGACSDSPAASGAASVGSNTSAPSGSAATSDPTGSAKATATATDAATLIPTATTSVTTPGTTTTLATSTATGEDAAPPPGAVALPTEFITVDKTIKDSTVGHTITVTKLARNVSWPDGQRAQSAAFELVMIEMKWTAGTTYSAPIRTIDFALITGSTYPNRPDAILDPALVAAGWTKLPDQLTAGQEATGWMVFKVDPKNAPTIRLEYTRPTLKVLDTNKTLAKKVYPLPLVG